MLSVMLTLAILALGGALLLGWRALEESEGASAAAETALLAEPADRQLLEPVAEETAADKATIQESDRKLNQNLAIASAGLGLAGLGALCCPPLGVVSVAFTAYAGIPLYKYAYHALFQERRLRVVTFNAAVSILTFIKKYYVASAIGVLSFLLSRKILKLTEDHARQNLHKLFGTQPRSAFILQDGVEIEIPIEQLQPGDLVVVNAGQVIPADGVICQGLASIEEQMLTGQAQPVQKGPEQFVLASTVVRTGRICMKVERSGAATISAQLDRILQASAEDRSEHNFRGESLADESILPILGTAAIGGLIAGGDAVLPILSSNFVAEARVSMPLSRIEFLNLAMQEGILLKDARALERFSDVDTVVFAKTGTLTLDEPHLGAIHTCYGLSADALLTYAAAAEAKQNHPIARTILKAAEERALPLPILDNAHHRSGYGIHAEIDSCSIRVGSARFLESESISIPQEIQDFQKQIHSQGHSLVYVAIGERLAGVLELRPVLRPEAQNVIAALHDCGLSLYVISGDHEAPTKQLAAKFGIDHSFAEVRPEDKAAVLEKLQQEGRKVCFVSNGDSDTSALQAATVSAALRSPAPLANSAAQAVLLDGTLQKLPELFSLSKEFADNARNGTLLKLIPSVFAVGGVLFLGFGIYTALLLSNLTLAASILHALKPAWRRIEKPTAPQAPHLLADARLEFSSP